MPEYTQALLLNRDIVLTGEVNCDLLTKNPRGDALCSFCISVNAKQLIEKPTRVTKNCRSLLDVILVSNPDLVQSSDVRSRLDYKRSLFSPRCLESEST